MKTLYHNGQEAHTESASAVRSQIEDHVEDIDIERFIQEVIHSKQEVEIARQQFDAVSDPLLIDHIVFRLGAAEKRLNYLFQLARRMDVCLDGIHWGWSENA